MGHLRFSTHWAQEMEHIIEETMEALEASTESEDTDVVAPTGQLYCSCMECYRREVIHLTVLHTLRGVRQGLVELVVDNYTEQQDFLVSDGADTSGGGSDDSQGG